ncbi:MAG: energy transducer TonB [Spirochaetaceae bacterium]|jgi:protein TonB|nr:energy transducer TonB [Spirochaetaceae bacterium]
MVKDEKNVKDRLRRGGVFVVVSTLHVLLLFFIVFTVEVKAGVIELPASVMKLTDIAEEEPAPAPEPPKPLPPPPVELTISDPVAETIIEVEEEPVELAAAPSAAPAVPAAAPAGRYNGEYLPQNMVSVLPYLDERAIRSRLVYPSIALRSGLEGIVYIELYIDRDGRVRRVEIIKENPPGRGFGEAAVKAFEGISGRPAQANGEAVAVRYRYPVRFQIK